MLIKQFPRYIISTKQNINQFIRCFSSADIGKRHPKPYDYRNKYYGVLGRLTDSTLQRLSDNSLIITVDGNIGSGKTEFAKNLAKEIDFHYAKEINFDEMLFIKGNNANQREIVNSLVGDHALYHVDTLEEWHANPTFKSTIQMQYFFYYCRFMQYRNALLHLLSTGQGVVLERSPYSDQVIAEALYENQYLSKEAWIFYKTNLVKLTMVELWKPHVVIYLDRSVDDCLKKLSNSNSKLHSREYLKTIESIYKKSYLPSIRNDAAVLTYDPNDIVFEEIVNDLESINLDDAKKFSNWHIRREADINLFRSRLSTELYWTMLFRDCTGYLRVPEARLFGEELATLEEQLEEHPQYHYDDKFTGKKSVFLKMFDFLQPKKIIGNWI